jgi:hypothetical protein
MYAFCFSHYLALPGEKQSRHFAGVIDDKANQGELFGVHNLFRLCSRESIQGVEGGDRGVTEDQRIFQRGAAVTNLRHGNAERELEEAEKEAHNLKQYEEAYARAEREKRERARRKLGGVGPLSAASDASSSAAPAAAAASAAAVAVKKEKAAAGHIVSAQTFASKLLAVGGVIGREFKEALQGSRVENAIVSGMGGGQRGRRDPTAGPARVVIKTPAERLAAMEAQAQKKRKKPPSNGNGDNAASAPKRRASGSKHEQMHALAAERGETFAEFCAFVLTEEGKKVVSESRV